MIYVVPGQTTPCPWTHHDLLICAPAQSFLKALGSVSEAAVLERQRVHLILASAAFAFLIAMSRKAAILALAVYLQRQSDLLKLFLQRLGLLFVGHFQIWHM